MCLYDRLCVCVSAWLLSLFGFDYISSQVFLPLDHSSNLPSRILFSLSLLFSVTLFVCLSQLHLFAFRIDLIFLSLALGLSCRSIVLSPASGLHFAMATRSTILTDGPPASIPCLKYFLFPRVLALGSTLTRLYREWRLNLKMQYITLHICLHTYTHSHTPWITTSFLQTATPFMESMIYL